MGRRPLFGQLFFYGFLTCCVLLRSEDRVQAFDNNVGNISSHEHCNKRTVQNVINDVLKSNGTFLDHLRVLLDGRRLGIYAEF